MAQHNASPVGTSALNPAHPTVTEAEAAAIVSRPATAADMAEADADNAAEQAELEAAADLADYAGGAAGRAFAVAERSGHTAILAAALSMVLANAPRSIKGQEASPGLDEFAFNTILAAAAKRGVLIYRNTPGKRDSEMAVDAITAATDPAEKQRLAVAYVKGFTGGKLADGPANLKTNADRLARYVRADKSAPDVIGALFSYRDNHVAAMPAWRELVAATTGCQSKGALAEFLKDLYGRAPNKAKAAKAKAAATVAGIPLAEPKLEPVPATVIPAPVAETRTVTVVKSPDFAAMPEADRTAAALEILATLGDDALEAAYQRLATMRDARQEARAAAALEAMRADADKAADVAAAKAADVLAVEVALAA